MTPFRTLGARPWMADQVRRDDMASGRRFGVPAQAIALRIFLVVATVLFSLLYVAYATRMNASTLSPSAFFCSINAFSRASSDWRPLQEPGLLWFNTAFLVFCSLVYLGADHAAAKKNTRQLKNAMILVGILSISFLIGQLLVWQQLNAAGFFARANPSYGFFYMLTGIHGLHLIGGLVFWAILTVRLFQGASPHSLAVNIRLCGQYWHYLLVVWVAIFLLLLLT
ncbi:cytochrome c oxidase subunit 3 [Sneathiella chinensis]|uniref:Cytochrome-c oxidase n=1 Tax=Sneathiella chinensis TaxID=349750 RepID=A0ABQ5U6H5_9PROT|nr:cytochrome c oxidase subunit 3 [Sneathiella chinensis]GLQ06086.1 cytochrome-c oxidase [Sneathiella chinensis]